MEVLALISNLPDTATIIIDLSVEQGPNISVDAPPRASNGKTAKELSPTVVRVLLATDVLNY